MKEQHIQEKGQNKGTMKGERGYFSMVSSRVRVARLSTAMLFFCCHKCHTGKEKERKIRIKQRNEKSVFRYCFIVK